MKQIFKYQLGMGICSISMPDKAIIRHLALQNGLPTIWAEVDKTAPLTTRTFHTVGTGWDIPANKGYHGTYQLLDGTVWHVYEV